MDETDSPQTPPELLVILAAIADQGIPIQTIAPKFTGRFNKGVDYVGDPMQFEKEFNDDLAVIAHAIKTYGLPATLKLSVHSGSDKFSIYPYIRKAIQRTGAGLHIKTAGTTWLEEIIGLAEAGGEGLALAKKIYAKALEKKEALCEPYATVIDIKRRQAPSAEEVNGWTSTQFTDALRHDPDEPRLQRGSPPASPRRIQDRRATRRHLHPGAQGQLGSRRQKRHRQSVGPPHEAALPVRRVEARPPGQ